MSLSRFLSPSYPVPLLEGINSITKGARLHSWLTRLSTLVQAEPPAPVMLERLLIGEVTLAEKISTALLTAGKRTNQPGTPTSVSGFIGVAGMDAFREIALSAIFHCIASDLERKSGLPPAGLVLEAVAMGSIARSLTEKVAPALRGESYAAGFLANIGVPFVGALQTEYVAFGGAVVEKGIQLHAAESETFGYDHASVGQILLQDYDFPRGVIAACSAHPHSMKIADLSAAVALAETIAHGLGFTGAFPIAAPELDKVLFEKFRMEESDLDKIATDAFVAVSNAANDFGYPLG